MKAAAIVRNTRPEDFDGIIALTRLVYPTSMPWRRDQLASHLAVFPEGQFVAIDGANGSVLGCASSLIVRWADYDMGASWRDFTDAGMFTNHDPSGRTLYGAEVMVHPEARRRRIGSKLYVARRQLTEDRGILRIRAAARLRGYHRYHDKLSASDYVVRLVRGEYRDPTLSFQIALGFDVLAVIEGYLRDDPESLGYAAVIEWINRRVATPADFAGRDPVFARPDSAVDPTAGVPEPGDGRTR